MMRVSLLLLLNTTTRLDESETTREMDEMQPSGYLFPRRICTVDKDRVPTNGKDITTGQKQRNSRQWRGR